MSDVYYIQDNVNNNGLHSILNKLMKQGIQRFTIDTHKRCLFVRFGKFMLRII
jgi:hypothetical protein